MKKLIYRRGFIVEPEDLKWVYRLADSMYESRGDGWEAYTEQLLEKFSYDSDELSPSMLEELKNKGEVEIDT